MTVGVRALAEQMLREGDLVSGFSARPRPIDAIRAHQKIQDERPENYTAEVSVSHTIEEELFDLKIGGRIDGLFPASSENPPMVEEIKTTLMDPSHFSADPFPENPIHWGQGKIYAYLYLLANDLEEIGVQLTYAHLKTGEIRSFQKSFPIETLADFFHEVIGRYRRWAEIAVNWKIERDRSIRELAFPFPGYRPGQREMAVSVYRTIREGKQLMVGAPTGIGKTAAAIFPAVKALGEEHIDKLFFLAARTTGKGAAEKSAAHLEENGLRFRWLTLTAKARICFSVDGPCNAVSCPYAVGYYDRLDAGLAELLDLPRLTRQVIESVAEKHLLCPFELSLELILWADGIICDYNYAFDPKAYLRRIFDEKGKYGLLIDEAHNLVDRSREMFSAEIDKASVLAARKSLRGKRDALYRTLGKINSWMLQEKKGLDRKEKEDRNGNCFIADSPSPPEDLLSLLTAFTKAMEPRLSASAADPPPQALLDLFFEALDFLRVAQGFDETYALLYSAPEKNLSVRLFCIDPAPQMRAALCRSRSAILFSATLSPAPYFKTVLGLDEDADELYLSSPFPESHLKVLCANRISTRFKDRDATLSRVVESLAALVSGKKGNYLLFFPSYAYMEKALERFSGMVYDVKILVQAPGMGERERLQFMEHFMTARVSGEREGTLAGFAVMGGVFGEGIDLVGDRLSGAAIVGVGLPGISLERELIKQHFEGEYGAGYAYAYQFPGINRVLQAAGRVIRTEMDRGVVLLIDDRYFSFRYRNLLPKEWTPAAVLGPKDLKTALSQFWKSNGDRDASRNINLHHRTINGEDPCPAFKKSSSSR